MKTHKKILIIEGIFVFGVLVYLFFSTAPNQVFPLSGMIVAEPDFNIEIENGEEVFISLDKEFKNPIILKPNSEVYLIPGFYYWKVKSGIRESEIKNFTIQGIVGLDLKNRGENYELQNSGNLDLNVTKTKKGFTSNTILEVGQSKVVEKEDSNYEGEQI